MPSLQQIRAVSGRGSPVRLEDLNQARLPSLYSSRGEALANQQTALQEQGLALSSRGLDLRKEEADMQAGQQNSAILTQGLGTAIQGGALVEMAYPGTLSSLGAKFLPGTFGAAAPTVAASSVAPVAGTLPGGTGISAAYPLFGGASESALGASAPAALAAEAPAVSGAATAAGLGAAPAAAEVGASTVAPTIGATAAPAAAAGGAASGVTLGSALGPAGFGFAAGSLVGKPLGQLFGLKGRAGGAAGGALGGAAAGAAAGSLAFPVVGTGLGAILGAVSGAIGGAISMIASAVYGWDHPATQMAEVYRKKFVGQTTYLGYKLWGATMVSRMEAYPILKPLVEDLIVDPCVRAMAARLLNLPHVYVWEQAYLDAWLRSSTDVGRQVLAEQRQARIQLKKGA